MNKRYIGTRIVVATLTSENEYLRHEGVNVEGREDRDGYCVTSADGGETWVSKQQFEATHREITETEKELLNEINAKPCHK